MSFKSSVNTNHFKNILFLKSSIRLYVKLIKQHVMLKLNYKKSCLKIMYKRVNHVILIIYAFHVIYVFHVYHVVKRYGKTSMEWNETKVPPCRVPLFTNHFTYVSGVYSPCTQDWMFTLVTHSKHESTTYSSHGNK